MKRISRRDFLTLSAVSAGLTVLGASGCTPASQNLPPELDLTARQETSSSTSAADTTAATDTTVIAGEDGETQVANLTLAATQFLEALDEGQRAKAMYGFDDQERFRWHWTTPGRFPRNGLPLREMNGEQRGNAVALLEAGLSSLGFEKALNIISLQVNLGNDPELYFVTLFGEPGGADPWGWRWEGHHLSHHFSIVDGQVSMTPFFLGSWPTTTEAGLRAMPVEEDAALELVNALSGEARQVAIFQERPITQHVTQNAAQVNALEPVGILYSALDQGQQQLITEIIHAYLDTQPAHLATDSIERINTAGLDQIRFGWAGSLDRQRPQYYRLQGPTFLLEYDNTRNGGTHIHSVWRDFERDFGYHLL